MSANLLTIKEASEWASVHTGRAVTTSNISYLVQYGRIRKVSNGSGVRIAEEELAAYYDTHRHHSRAERWQKQLGTELNWTLSFEQYKEAETTKHVHRLHPYKGKFIPQLVEYFLDDHTDNFKKEVYFRRGDIVLDPFSGSGTTMVQASELGIHCIGVDVSAFNALMGNAKVANYDIADVEGEVRRITRILKAAWQASPLRELDDILLRKLQEFNHQHFPVPDYKYRVRHGEIDEKTHGAEKEKEFLPVYRALLRRYGVTLAQPQANTFLDKWYFAPVRAEIELVFAEIKKIKNPRTRKMLGVILSRTIRSCRATTHADLGTLLEPVYTSYYCAKHGKMCKPLLSIFKRWDMYSKDTLRRLAEFAALRTDTMQYCLTGDSRKMDIVGQMKKPSPTFHKLLQSRKIDGIFSSPPYVGLIDYHEQHAYAYDLFNMARKDGQEIGPLSQGQGSAARQSYVEGVSAVLNQCGKYLSADCNVFLVANDKYDLYPTIAGNAGLEIVNRFNRPVLNRTEKDKRAYAETIFHMRRV